ncbi:MAG TPA: DUF2780 domain-containing protein [Vicinamibacteria bacterium]|nr:DUF2780 domain-containing protein [Vicinamibacteria bacterium]
MNAERPPRTGFVSRTIALFLFFPASIALAQATAPPQAAPPVPAPEKTVAQTASPEIVGQLVDELAISPKQAEGAAGTLFGVAKGNLKAEDFEKVAAAVPNMAGLLAAAPSSGGSALAPLTGAAGSLGGAAAAAGTLSKLGIKPDTIAKVAPTLVKAVQSKGGAEAAQLLATALK